MKDYSTLPNTSGAFPNVVGLDATGPGATDGTPYLKQVIDDIWGARQALMSRAELVPSGTQESATVSQFLQALELVIRYSSVRIRNWAETPTAISCNFRAAAYVETISGVIKNRWVAVGLAGASAIYSSRGGAGEWITRTVPSGGNSLRDVIWDTINDLFIAVGDDDTTDAQILTSPDGKTWTTRANPKAFDLRGVASDESAIIVAVGQADGTDAYIVTSPDGTTWTERSNPKNFQLNSVAWSPDLSLFCAVGVADGTDAYIVTSPDGITWTERANPSNIDLVSVTWGNGKFIAVGDQNGSNSPYIIESSNGIAWSAITIPEVGDVDAKSITYSSELDLFIGLSDEVEDDGAESVFFSADGTSWDVIQLPVDGVTLNSIEAGKSRVLVAGTNTIFYSEEW